MDKQEYKIRSEEIRTLVEEKNYREAADIADTIDWRRVKSVKMLCTISDIYKITRTPKQFLKWLMKSVREAG